MPSCGTCRGRPVLRAQPARQVPPAQRARPARQVREARPAQPARQAFPVLMEPAAPGSAGAQGPTGRPGERRRRSGRPGAAGLPRNARIARCGRRVALHARRSRRGRHPDLGRCGARRDLVRRSECRRRSPVRVNELMTGSTSSAANEFVELVNAGGAAADVGGWKLVYRSAAATGDVTLVTFPSGTTIPAGGFYLAGGAAYPGPRTRRSRSASPRRQRSGSATRRCARRLRQLRHRDERPRRGAVAPAPAAGQSIGRHRRGTTRTTTRRTSRSRPRPRRARPDRGGGRSTRAASSQQMVDATISCVRLRDLSAWAAPALSGGGPPLAVRFPRRTRRYTLSSRPGANDLVASTISGAQALVTMGAWPSPPRRSSMRASCARTSRSSSRRSTASRSPTSTPRPARRSRGRCSTR